MPVEKHDFGHHDLIIVSMIHGIAGHFPVRVTCWVLSAILLNMGFVLVGRPDFFHEQKVYLFMARVGSPEFWGITCILLGILRVLSLIINGTVPWFHWTPHMRSGLATLSCLIWFQFTIGFLTTPLSGLGVAVYPFLLLLDFYNAFMASIEAASEVNIREHTTCSSKEGQVEHER